jgi:hypothetical protein
MNTNNPDYVKHAKAALASKAEMDKWKNIEVIDAIAAVLSLVIAWFASSWMIAIVGIIICGAVGAYAASQKEKARQDALDHMNRADGMSESLVGATRGRREAEGALAGAINQLDAASSKLRRASTYEEKNKAEAEVVSAQAAIESAKLRLQQATAREASESKRSQQQTQPSATITNPSSQESLDIGFSGDKDLANDGYKIYLVKKHKIEKNDALGKFICNERLFNSIDEALAFADSLENSANEVISIPEIPEIPELIDGTNELRSNPTPVDDNATSVKDHKAIAQKKNRLVPILIVCAVIVIGLGIIYSLGKDNKPEVKNSSPIKNNQSTNDKDKINSIQKNGVDGWGLAQEALFKEGMALLLLNPNEKNSFRKIAYYQCVPSQSYQKWFNIVELCIGKEAYYTKITSDKVVPMSETYKDLSQYEESQPYFKKENYDDKRNFKEQGWNFVRYYYDNSNCPTKDVVRTVGEINDYFSTNSGNKIKRVTYCNGVKNEQTLDAYSAEQSYVKSGMYKGD